MKAGRSGDRSTCRHRVYIRVFRHYMSCSKGQGCAGWSGIVAHLAVEGQELQGGFWTTSRHKATRRWRALYLKEELRAGLEMVEMSTSGGWKTMMRRCGHHNWSGLRCCTFVVEDLYVPLVVGRWPTSSPGCVAGAVSRIVSHSPEIKGAECDNQSDSFSGDHHGDSPQPSSLQDSTR